MIDAGYVRMMAWYNAWQNSQLADVVLTMSEDELTRDRGAFFGSIFATLNHILWGDQVWMSRFSNAFAPPKTPAARHFELTDTIADWSAERFRMDGRIRVWAEGLSSLSLQGDLEWFSGMSQKDMKAPMAQAVVGLFNHQTHHRGQVHAMLTDAGQNAPVTDLAFMPEGV